LFANGYRSPGLPLDIPENTLADDVNGVHRFPYAQGFATGRSAYDKAGMGVQTGVESTYRLKQFVDRLGATRTYIMGGSMGADITLALIEKYPADFVGAMAVCGPVGGWVTEIGFSIDVRAAYNYFTRDTDYELPGEKSIAVSAVASLPGTPHRYIALPFLLLQARRVVSPVVRLFEAAAANPAGPESRIIDNIASVAGTVRDPAALVFPIVLVAMGMDDFNETLGGSIYDNTTKVYSSSLLSAEENAALNAGIERIKADPAAVAKAHAWYTPTGKFKIPLLTLYNEIDPLVPQALHEPALRKAAEAEGNGKFLVQRSVASKRDVIATTKTEGYAHCGFTADQVEAAWTDLRAWVEVNRKPRGQ
jgi:pimeloyl-ACP methyl ester carboxylesterase